MARGAGKKPSKASKTTSTSSFTSTESTTSTWGNAVSPFPSPFKAAPTSLLSLTDTLPKDHVFIFHVESTPPGLRKQTFLVPVILNLMIVAVLGWRVYYAVPAYLEQIITIMGYETSWTVKPKSMDWSNIGEIIMYRTFLLSVDYAMFGLLGRWPWEFVFGDKYGRYIGACGWKWNVGFSREKEPIARRGRKWDLPIYQRAAERKALGKPEHTWTKEEELEVYTKCSDGLRKVHTAKNALSLLDKDWDLDYAAMVDAAELLDAAKLSPVDIDHVVLIPWQGKWYSWYPHHVVSSDGAAQVSVEQKDEKLESFRKSLSQINCEDVFYRWIEIIQYETSQPTGFTVSRKQDAEQQLRKMLRTRGKDDDAFFQSVGGLANIPGLATT